MFTASVARVSDDVPRACVVRLTPADAEAVLVRLAEAKCSRHIFLNLLNNLAVESLNLVERHLAYKISFLINKEIQLSIDYPKSNPKPKSPKPKANIAGFPASTLLQVFFILPTMSSKRKRVVLSFIDKLKIVDQDQLNGGSGSSIAWTYGVGNATISDIKEKSDAIITYDSALDNEDESLYRKAIKITENKDLYAADINHGLCSCVAKDNK
ncbi:hypothetical protein LAZ67_X002617 [Cordylochernes scorpioides]|uniref:HTH psq-type domain-containing protein n=1 Tax=Cordylochernes scorpioides TaxID=51811 RepID=A0ABY6LU11_9ARAC|nr:hypothetical protein LAZ67_X002617 [Cordylochernes scorpioides]